MSTNEFDDLIAGWKYSATLSMNTPLMYLEHDGEFVEGPNQPPLIGPPENRLEDGTGFNRHGIWLKVIKQEEGETPLPLGRRAAQGGMVQAGSDEENNLINFLISFRRIVESEADIDQKIKNLENLSLSTPENNQMWDRLSISSPIIESYFSSELSASLPDGIGNAKAEALYRAGYRTIKEIKEATDEELLAIQGIGKGLIKKLRL